MFWWPSLVSKIVSISGTLVLEGCLNVSPVLPRTPCWTPSTSRTWGAPRTSPRTPCWTPRPPPRTPLSSRRHKGVLIDWSIFLILMYSENWWLILTHSELLYSKSNVKSHSRINKIEKKIWVAKSPFYQMVLFLQALLRVSYTFCFVMTHNEECPRDFAL